MRFATKEMTYYNVDEKQYSAIALYALILVACHKERKIDKRISFMLVFLLAVFVRAAYPTKIEKNMP